MYHIRVALLVAFLMSGLLAACGGGSGGSGSAPLATTTYTVGGTVSGLMSGSQVTLLDNGDRGNALLVGGDGGFQFSSGLASGSTYAVTVGAQPIGETCSVNSGSGTISANVGGVSVTCSTTTYTVGGNVAALPSGGSVVLKNNGADPLTATATGAFTFSNAVANGAGYSVTTYAPGESCTVTNGSGTASANVTNVSVSCAAGTESVLWGFGGTGDGASPYAGLVMDSAGNLYGTTSSGGAHLSGTVFKLTPGSGGTYSESVLWSFGGTGDGTSPYAGLVMDSAGNLYGTTYSGGAHNSGTVFKIMPEGGGTYTESVLWSFGGTGDGKNPEAGLIMDSAGNLYGTTSSGGAHLYGTVFKLTPGSGGPYTESVLWSFGGTGDGTSPYAGLVMDSAGNLYGTTVGGGAYLSGTVFKLTPGSGGTYSESVLWSFGGTTGDGQDPYAGLVMDSSGNLYGTTYYGDANSTGTVFKLTPGSGGTYSESVLWSFGAGGTGDGQHPYAGLVMDSSGNLYGTTFHGGANTSGAVFKLTPGSGGTYTESVLWSFGGTTGDGQHPYAGLVMDSAGNLYGTTYSGSANGSGAVFKLN